MEFDEIKKEVREKLINDFRDFCNDNYKDKLSEGTIDDYVSHLNNTNSCLEQAINHAIINSFKNSKALNAAYKNIKFDKNDYLFLIGWYLYNGDKLYAMTIFDIMYKLIKRVIKELSKSIKNTPNATLDKILQKIRKRHAAFNILKEFLILFNVKKVVTPAYYANCANYANDVRKKINKGDLYKLDGMDLLIAKLGIPGFISLAVDSSYFFSPDLVMNQTIDLTKARHTTDNSINLKNQPKKSKRVTYMIEGVKYIVDIDKDNNAAVRSLINEKTGITVSSGKGSILQNTVISHVWGRAYDPRYFTSLWNIVLIPAWANSLMDKEDAEGGSLASKIRATYMAVCTKLYSANFNNSQYWQKIQMKGAPDIPNKNDIIKGDYKLYILNEKDDNAIEISLTTVSI